MDRINMACLRRQMAKLGLDDNGLAEKGGWPVSTVRDWTSGRHSPLSPAKRTRLAQVLKVKHGELYRNVSRGTPRRPSPRAKARARHRAQERRQQQVSMPAGEQQHIQLHLEEDFGPGAQLELPLEIRVLPPRRILQEALEEVQQALQHMERALMLQLAVEAAGGKI